MGFAASVVFGVVGDWMRVFDPARRRADAAGQLLAAVLGAVFGGVVAVAAAAWVQAATFFTSAPGSSHALAPLVVSAIQPASRRPSAPQRRAAGKPAPLVQPPRFCRRSVGERSPMVLGRVRNRGQCPLRPPGTAADIAIMTSALPRPRRPSLPSPLESDALRARGASSEAARFGHLARCLAEVAACPPRERLDHPKRPQTWRMLHRHRKPGAGDLAAAAKQSAERRHRHRSPPRSAGQPDRRPPRRAQYSWRLHGLGPGATRIAEILSGHPGRFARAYARAEQAHRGQRATTGTAPPSPAPRPVPGERRGCGRSTGVRGARPRRSDARPRLPSRRLGDRRRSPVGTVHLRRQVLAGEVLAGSGP